MPQTGELALLVNPAGKRYLRRVEPGNDLHTNEGVLEMAELARVPFGGVARTRQGSPFKVMCPPLPTSSWGSGARPRFSTPRTSATSACALARARGGQSLRPEPAPAA